MVTDHESEQLKLFAFRHLDYKYTRLFIVTHVAAVLHIPAPTLIILPTINILQILPSKFDNIQSVKST